MQVTGIVTRLSLFFLVALALMAVVPASASAQGSGNSEAAQACKDGGWTELLRSDETPFRNQGQCVSYAVQGGSFYEAEPDNSVTPIISAQLGAPGQWGDFSVEISGSGFTAYTDDESLNLNVWLYGGDSFLGGAGYRTSAEPDGTISHVMSAPSLTCDPFVISEVAVYPDRMVVFAEDAVTFAKIASTTIQLDCAPAE